MLVFENKIAGNKELFIDKLRSVSNKLLVNPNHLMIVMYAESKLNPKAYNPNGGASGLIQFMPSTAAWLGTTTAAIRAMSNVDQLDYVLKYFQKLGVAGKLNSVYDVYMAVFFPAALGKPGDWQFKSSTQSAYLVATNNKIIDLDGNNIITVNEFKKYIDKFLTSRGVDLSLIKTAMTIIDYSIIATFIILGVLVGYKIFKN